jgi:hypothetical protein
MWKFLGTFIFFFLLLTALLYGLEQTSLTLSKATQVFFETLKPAVP